MKQSYLIQRLQKPYPGCENNPFTFGGGLCRGGMNADAYKLLNQIFRFDYMGAAEFEFGAVPNALSQIVSYFNAGEGVTGEIKIGGTPIYYLCIAGAEAEVKKRILDLSNPGKNKIFTKERIMLDEALKIRHPERIPEAERRWYTHAADMVGWLELDNDFMFFIDKLAFDKFVALITGKEEPK